MKKRVDMVEVRARLLESQSKPVRLRVAAAAAHQELTQQPRSSMFGPRYIAALTRAATQLAQVVDVYHVVQGKLLRIPDEVLRSGVFHDGGNLLRTASGEVYRALSVRRIDVMEGLEILRHR